MTTILYGIPNCDQVKKARTWLDVHAGTYVFHDFKKAGIHPDLIDTWLKDVAWDVLINRKGTTWRALPEQRKAAIIDAFQAIPDFLCLKSCQWVAVVAAAPRLRSRNASSCV